MPIKLPKGFSRRKSSGTALEEVENSPEPSFRVFERPAGGSKSFDGGIALKRMSQGRPLSSPSCRVDENLFDDERDKIKPSHRWVGEGDNGWGSALTYGRESGGTNHSSSTGGLYDTSSSSARFSSTSTLPSSTDATPEESHPPAPQNLHDIPVPPIPESQPAFSVRAAGRTFSFGRKAAQSSSPGSATQFGIAHVETSEAKGSVRERAMTTSSFASASTATPPKLLDADLNLGGSDFDGFGNMFESFGKRGSRAFVEHGVLNIPNTASPVSRRFKEISPMFIVNGALFRRPSHHQLLLYLRNHISTRKPDSHHHQSISIAKTLNRRPIHGEVTIHGTGSCPLPAHQQPHDHSTMMIVLLFLATGISRP